VSSGYSELTSVGWLKMAEYAQRDGKDWRVDSISWPLVVVTTPVPLTNLELRSALEACRPVFAAREGAFAIVFDRQVVEPIPSAP